MEKIIREKAFDKKKKKPGLKLNPPVALTGVRTIGPWMVNYSIASKVAPLAFASISLHNRRFMKQARRKRHFARSGRGGGKKKWSFIFLLPSSRNSRSSRASCKMPRSPRLLTKRLFMQATLVYKIMTQQDANGEQLIISLLTNKLVQYIVGVRWKEYHVW